MAEKLLSGSQQSDLAATPEQLLKDVQAAIDDVEKAVTEEAAPAAPSAVAPEKPVVATAPVAAETRGSVFANPAKNESSLFIGGGNGKASYRRTAIVPETYSEKKEAAKAAQPPAKRGGQSDLVSSARIASQSLTGASGASKKAMPPKGMKSSAIPEELRKEMGVIQKALSNRYENTSQLLRDLGNGVDAAEMYVQKNGVKLAAPPSPQGSSGKSA